MSSLRQRPTYSYGEWWSCALGLLQEHWHNGLRLLVEAELCCPPISHNHLSTTWKRTRRSAIRRETAHLTLLYMYGTKGFSIWNPHGSRVWQYTVTPSVEWMYNAKLQTLKAAALSTACDLSLIHSFRVNPWTQDYEIWPQETRNIAASCGVERSTDYYFVLSQYRQTDGRTDVDSKSSPLHVDAR